MENKTIKIAAIRIRGSINVRREVNDTLTHLRMYRKNYCVVLPNNDSTLGMLRKAKDYITWGEISDEVYNELIEKRGQEYLGPVQDSKGKIKYNKFITVNNKKLKPYFRLNPPKGGFERKGIKTTFENGGALGYRKEDINNLIKKMI